MFPPSSSSTQEKSFQAIEKKEAQYHNPYREALTSPCSTEAVYGAFLNGYLPLSS